MDWDPKMPSWDLGTVVGPSGVAGGGALDLKLGAPTSWKAAPPPAAASSSPAPALAQAAPAKRPRAGQGQQAAAPPCSVEGCTADLSKCRDYHRRHKVCEAHSKTPVVTVAGQQQRFCQQCSRFHLLGEFDETKRSCRKRLDGHNRRRRKPQPDPLNPGGLFAGHHGATRFASYQQIFSTSSMAAEPKWPAVKAEAADAATFHDPYYPALHLNGTAAAAAAAGASLFHGKERKHFPFLTDGGDGGAAAYGCQPFTITPPSESSSNSSRQSNGGKAMFAANDGGLDNCALSLLSDAPTHPAHHQIMIPATAAAAPPLATAAGMHYGGVAARLPSESDVSLTGLSYVRFGDKGASTSHTATATTSAAQLHYHGYYHVSADQGGSDGAIQALPFTSW